MTRVMVDAEALEALLVAVERERVMAKVAARVRASVRKVAETPAIPVEDEVSFADNPPLPALWDHENDSK